MPIVDIYVNYWQYEAMKRYDPIQYVELFHLFFLLQLGLKMDRRLYALKGGCNLRFFLKSIRYSQDMDIDVHTIQSNTLHNKVNKILEASSTKLFLQSNQMEILNYSTPKQTQTTQKWKISLKISTLSTPLNTKIEFSRRKMSQGVIYEPIDPLIIAKYQLTPQLVSHYNINSAVEQKLQALIGRNETQSRDVFDLYHLINIGGQFPTLSTEMLQQIQEHITAISFEDFKGQVIAYLPIEYQAQYDSKEMWQTICLTVLGVLKKCV